MILYVTRMFPAAHFLPNYVGPCSLVHGHTWKVEVWIDGHVNQATGMVVDFKKVKDIIDHFDHGNLNEYIANPTAENITKRLVSDINAVCPKYVQVAKLRLWESEDSYVEWWKSGYDVNL